MTHPYLLILLAILLIAGGLFGLFWWVADETFNLIIKLSGGM